MLISAAGASNLGVVRLVFRLTTVLTLSICLVFAAYLYLSVRLQARLFDTDVRRDQHVLGRALGTAVAAVWSDDQPRLGLSLVNVANEREAKVQIRWVPLPEFTDDASVLDPDWEANALAGREWTHVERGEDGPARLHTFRPVVVDGVTVGVIELSESLAEESAFLRSRIKRAAVAGGLMVLVSAVLSMALGLHFVGRPVRSLIEKARRIGAGDFSGPLSLPRHDELAELAREMNTMADHLAAANSRLAEETRVRIATLEQLRHAERLSTLGRLASGIAHELGTPLNVVSGRAMMIASGESDAEEVSENVRIIMEQTERMAAIIRQVLDLARRPTLERVVSDVAPLIEDTLGLLSPFAVRKGVRLTYEPPPPGAPVRAAIDPAKIRQVLTNLVMNAIQANPEGGVVSVGCENATVAVDGEEGVMRRYARISVDDEGPGIDETLMSQIFEPFFTTKAPGEGTGLGLSLARGIAQDHGGWIDVERLQPRGTRFSLFVPEELAS